MSLPADAATTKTSLPTKTAPTTAAKTSLPAKDDSRDRQTRACPPNQISRSIANRIPLSFELPDGVTRITENAIKRLVQGPINTLPLEPQLPKVDACRSRLVNAFYYINLRARIDQLVWQTLLLLDPKTPP